MIQVVRDLKRNTIVPFELRTEDARECEAMGVSPDQAIEDSVRQSLEAFQVILDDEVICVWGYFPSSPLGHSCSVWMLSGEAANKHKIFLARESRRLRDLLLKQFPCVVVMVDVRYIRSWNWLTKYLGFSRTGFCFNSPLGVPFEYLRLDRGMN